jgi:ribose/xylose/arabinose/galactoside ABC-type transport system permease subunit
MIAARGLARPRSTDVARLLIPIGALIVMAVSMAVLQPRVTSYIGMQLVLSFALPLMFASLAQLSVIAASDIDFGIGPFIGFVNCLTAAFMVTEPFFCCACLVGCALAYAGLGAFIQLRRLPSIVVTLGASFIWLGLALIVMPTPGGTAPEWLSKLVRLRPPFIPLPIVAAIVVAAFGHWLFKRSSYSVVLRGVGSAAASVQAAGWSLVVARSVLYGLAGIFGIISGLLLTGLINSGDANVGTAYTLLSVSAVIVGGAEFAGGIVSPIGAIIGVFVMLLAGTLLSFMNVPSDWQLSVQGTLLILVLGARLILRRRT